jgi:hypothetical protein
METTEPVANSPVKLVKQLTKRSDQDWSGVWFKNADLKTAMNSKEDPRDCAPTDLTEQELTTLKKHVSSNVRKARGYMGWDREYVTDDVLRVIYYFANREAALGYLEGNWNIKDSQVFNEYKNILSSRKSQHQYQAQWIFIDQNGNEENIPPKS